MKQIQKSMIRFFVIGTIALMGNLYGQSKSPATFLFEGQMLDRDTAVNGQCRFRVELWDQQTGNGVRVGPVQVYEANLEQGRFRIRLNEHGEFGPSAFRNHGYWLELGVQCSGDSEFVRFEDRRWVGAPAQTYDLSWWTVDGGGGTSTGGNLELTGTVGQPDAGAAAGGTLTLGGGFWGAIGSDYRIYLPAVSRSS